MSKKENLEVVDSIMESIFYKDATSLCMIVKGVAHYVLMTPHVTIPFLMSHLILTVARPLDFRLVYFLSVVLSAVISCIY